MRNEQAVTTGFPILGVLGLIFITLKLTGFIAWSWLWVLAPFWLPVVFYIAFVVVAIVALSRLS